MTDHERLKAIESLSEKVPNTLYKAQVILLEIHSLSQDRLKTSGYYGEMNLVDFLSTKD